MTAESETLYHYCGNDFLVSFLESKELWLSDLSLSNDTMEGKWLGHLFVKHCQQQSIARSTIDRLIPHLDFLLTALGGVGFCLSEEGDLLSQWRGYADGGTGMAVGFNRAHLDAFCRDLPEKAYAVRLRKVEYSEEQQIKAIKAPAERILNYVNEGAFSFGGLLIGDEGQQEYDKKFRAMSFSFLLFLPMLFTFKNPAFQEEREWRLVSAFSRSGEASGLGEMPSLEFRASSDRIIPYRKLKLSENALPLISEIVLGPRNITHIDVAKAMLARHGMTSVNVRRSTATYR